MSSRRAPSPSSRDRRAPSRSSPEPRAPASSLRSAVEQRSGVLLVALSRQPRWLLPLVSALLLGGVVLLPPVAALACLVLLLALVGWLSYLSWPVVDARGRAVRLASLTVIVVLGVRALSS